VTPRTPKTKPVDRAEWRLYLAKAADFYETMLAALASKNWNSVGLAAVHCSISATDALLASRTGTRSVSPDHGDVVQLLQRNVKSDGASQNSKCLLRIIRMKNEVEYESRSFTEREAAAIVRDTERYFGWVKSLLPS